ncbi:predicted protein [Nematostella vectensis]|uniref:Uncharacterized protein n=1 Tax=Nematostella vectensis TaxID=45351 RepID=A7T4X3_NEMVE|nr:predicted protein [Nematostella vectensis]|eukprot:XP_001621089.1 hypothetical protein NEMVEDRAFT_v1g222376 [Nematostella vectensis]
MAGNIPLVGFHDFLSVLITGHSVIAKQSSNDKHLLPFLAKYLEYVEPTLKGAIEFTEEKLTDYDAVIATGSNNTARYFEYYFKGKPSIIRKSRNSVAILTGMYNKHEIINNIKYSNNYDYNKAVYLMSAFDLLENGFIMIKEDQSYASPIATVFYEYYSDVEFVKNKIAEDSDKIQCVVSNGIIDSEIAFGQTQTPKLWDYADGINTLEFLGNI